MKKKSVFTLFIASLFLVSVILFFAFGRAKNRQPIDNFVCSDDSPCVRFCDEDQSLVLNELSNDFEILNPITNVTNKFQILIGPPCKAMHLYSESDEWKFSSVSRRECSPADWEWEDFRFLRLERIYFGEWNFFHTLRILSRNKRRNCKPLRVQMVAKCVRCRANAFWRASVANSFD